MAALPNFDDPYRVADFGALAGEIDADRQSVTESQAVDMVMDCLIGRSDQAFGEEHEWWQQIIDDATERFPRERAVLLIAPNAFGSSDMKLRRVVRAAIHHEVQRLLAEHHDAELEARYGY